MARILDDYSRRCLADVAGEYVFRVHDGSIFRNLKELHDGLANMSDETYSYHVNASKNDFSQWVRYVVRDDKLANDLQASASREAAAKRVGTRVTALGRRPSK